MVVYYKKLYWKQLQCQDMFISNELKKNRQKEKKEKG